MRVGDVVYVAKEYPRGPTKGMMGEVVGIGVAYLLVEFDGWDEGRNHSKSSSNNRWWIPEAHLQTESEMVEQLLKEYESR
jgi:hypothetical protein